MGTSALLAPLVKRVRTHLFCFSAGQAGHYSAAEGVLQLTLSTTIISIGHEHTKASSTCLPSSRGREGGSDDLTHEL